MRWKLALLALAAMEIGTASAQTLSPTAPDPSRSTAEVRRRLGAALEAKDSAATSRWVTQLACMGSTLSSASWEQIKPSLDPAAIDAQSCASPGWDKAKPALDRLRALFDYNVRPDLAPQGEFAQVPADYRLVEGIAWDKDRLFVGTVVDGRLAYLKKGKWHDVKIGIPHAGIFGMKADTARRTLWIATGSGDPTAITGERMQGLIVVNLDDLKVVRRIKLDEGQPGDVAFGADGSVYVNDTGKGMIHHCRAACLKLEPLTRAGSFRSPQGMVESADGKLLYVADYSTGLWAVSLTDGAIRPLTLPEPFAMESIDALLSPKPGTLIAIQNGTRPQRVVRFTLTADARSIARAEILAAMPNAGGEATLGVIEKGELLFIGDSQWERWGKGGVLTDGKPPRATVVRRLKL